MPKEYDTFVDDLSTLPEGKELVLAIRDLTPGNRKYDTRVVKAVVASSPDKLPDSDVLWLRFQRGSLRPEPWRIKIIEETEGLLFKNKIYDT
jgi:phenylphosphate carboxylase gamma subunit